MCGCWCNCGISDVAREISQSREKEKALTREMSERELESFANEKIKKLSWQNIKLSWHNITLEDIELFQMKVSNWARCVFGESDYKAQVLKLKEEVDELFKADKSNETDELADCFLLLIDIAYRMGYPIRRLVNLAAEKWITNLGRTWEVSEISEGYVIYKGKKYKLVE